MFTVISFRLSSFRITTPLSGATMSSLVRHNLQLFLRAFFFLLCLLGFGWLVRGQFNKYLSKKSSVAISWEPVHKFEVYMGRC